MAVAAQPQASSEVAAPKAREWSGVAVGEVARGVRGLVVLGLIGMGLGAAEFAVVALVGAIHTMGRMVGTLGLASASLRHFSTGPWSRRDDGHLLRVFGMAAVGSWLYSVAVAVAVPLVLASWFGFVPGRVWLWALLLLPLTALDHVIPSVLRARRASALFGGFFLLELAVGIAAAVYGGLYARDLGAYYMVLTLGKLATLAVLAAWWWAAHRARTIAEGVQRAPLPVLLRFGFSTMIVPFGVLLVTAGDRFVLGRFSDPATLGAYAAVSGFALALWCLPQLVYFGLYAQVVQAAEAGDPRRLTQVVRDALRLVVPILVVGAFVLGVLVLPIVDGVFGSVHGVSAAVVWLLMLTAVTGRVAAPFQYVLEAHDRGWFVQMVWITAGAVNVVLAALVVPTLGVAGAAATSAFVLLGLTGAMVLGAWSHLDVARLADRRSATWLAGFGGACLIALAGAPVGLGAVAALVSTGGVFLVTAGVALRMPREKPDALNAPGQAPRP